MLTISNHILRQDTDSEYGKNVANFTLGAMTAAQLFAAVQREIPDLLGNIRRGDFTPLLKWLRANVHNKGKILGFNDLMIAATGETLNAEYFKSHLEARYG